MALENHRLGKSTVSGEHILGLEDMHFNARSVKRLPETERYDKVFR